MSGRFIQLGANGIVPNKFLVQNGVSEGSVQRNKLLLIAINELI